jgi:hypothetical protein
MFKGGMYTLSAVQAVFFSVPFVAPNCHSDRCILPLLLEPTGGRAIFDPIRDTRSPGLKLWSRVAAMLLNITALAATVVFSQLTTGERLSRDLAGRLRKELGEYRIVLFEPGIAPSPPAPAPPLAKPAPARDTRLLERMDPAVTDFVAQHPNLDRIVTQELVRDLDAKVLNVGALLARSSLRVSFRMDSAGRVVWTGVDESSHVPSVDHLALELVRLLERYGILSMFGGVNRVTASVRVLDEKIEIALGIAVVPPEDIPAVRGKIEAGLTLWRLLLDASEASWLDGIKVEEAGDHGISVGKSIDKDAAVTLLRRYFRADSR